MKKSLHLVLVLIVTLLVGCNKNEDEVSDFNVTLDVQYEDTFEGIIYPSFLYSSASLQGLDEESDVFEFKINSNRSFEGRIRVTNDKFIKETVVSKNIKTGNNEFSFKLLWKFDNFVNITTPGYTHFKVELMDKSNKVIATKNIQLSYRGINECVYAVKNSAGEVKQIYSFFASYVNEDSKLLDTFLSLTLTNHNKQYKSEPLLHLSSGWAGYQLGERYVFLQVLAIVNQLYKMGMQYSSITDTSNAATKIYSQNVRFINESLILQNANCVDGSVLLASILEKIGIRCFLVTEPGHMYLAYSKTGKTEPDFSDLGFIETTSISSGNFPTIFNDKIITNESLFISIRKAREAGIKPIQ